MQGTLFGRKRATRFALVRRALAASALLAAIACEGEPTGPDLREVEFVSWLEVDLSTFTEHPSGIFYKDVLVGQGAAAANGSQVDIGVQGWLPDGFEVQNYWTPTNIRVGSGHVIQGLDLALVGMRAGGERKVVVPPHLAHEQDLVMVFRLQVMAVR